MSDYISRDEVLAKINDSMYTQAIKDSLSHMVRHVPAADVIPLGVEFWADRFDIKRRGWRSEDGESTAESFTITRKEEAERG